MLQAVFCKKLIRYSLAALATASALGARAQSPSGAGSALASSFRLPQLPEGGGDAAIVRAIQLKVVYPKQALRDYAQGQSLVSFAVAPSGQVCQVKLERSLRPDLDTAVVRAVRVLPRLQPAMQYGRPVACLLRAPVTFLIDNPARLPRHPLPAIDSAQACTTASRMPIYQGKLGYNHLAAELVAEYMSQSGGCAMPKYGAQLAVTVGPSGILYNVQLVRPDEAQRQALEANFGDQVAKKEFGDEEEFSDACLPQLAEAARRLPRLAPAYAAGRPVAMRLLLSLFNPNRSQ